ncbi:phosphatidylserine/phosphatidylglycerophosphate/cardiolipin synthase family protein [Sphingosinicella sp. LHD-64]|uniref:phospholipase D-like domain-containing protein n=1 Tax=Sphingosinicella sp. LHD-64 TaxID=3072139 RepID=UPI00280D7EB7|nr:phosphatidylserine/phosphatidylglycerophosphate/cardiolipin synthase family protein [Sphingosinicella sp. LHD-64]MDQ8758021.1 phosphatidylserine/phosphatidylglycerophosphate/cardiolipin synthase family protein [Sphingosinicella sp. LHD-64]
MEDALTEEPVRIAPIEVAGNRLTLLPDGPERLEALIGLIDGARESLRILYYIWENDAVGRRVRDALIAAARRGVEVLLLVDGFGAANAPDGFFRELTEAGARSCRFVPRFGRRYLLRNHQKLAVADGRRVIVGGFNIGADYFGTVAEGAWRDLGLLVEGDSVARPVAYFDDLFKWALKPEGSMRQLRRVLQKHSKIDGRLHWLFGGPTRRLSPWAKAVRKDMRSAKRLDIIAAYFAPGPVLLRRSGNVARRGAVRLVTAAKSDNNATIAAARYTYWTLLKRGVRIFEYQPTKLHTKLFVIDNVVHIGSANFDMRSLFLNLEMMLRIEDDAFAATMRLYVDGEVADSREITREGHKAQRTFLNRLRWAIGYFLVAIADYRITRRLNFAGEAEPT